MATTRLMKIATLGESGVGKTCIIEQWIHATFSSRSESTRGAAFKSKLIKARNANCDIKVNVWDTAGQEVYRSLTALYYKDADAVLLVYDVTNEKSFQELTYWLEQVQSKAGHNCFITIVGNKVDDVEHCKIDSITGQQFARKHNVGFIETSAKNNLNITEVFTQIITRKYPELMDAAFAQATTAETKGLDQNAMRNSTKLKPQQQSDADKQASRKGCKC